MIKHGKKQLYLQCFNATGTVSIYLPAFFSCSFRLALGNVLVVEFKERFYNQHFHSSVKCGQEQMLTIVVFENVGV